MLGNRPLGTASIGTRARASPVVVVPPAPTVTGVIISPATVTITTETLLHFNASVQGLNAPSQGVTWTKDGGGFLDASGNFVPPAQTNAIQVITLTATSQQDGTTKGFATVTILALAVTLPPVTPGTVKPISGKLDASAFINHLPIGAAGHRSIATLFEALIEDIQNLRAANARMAAKLDAAGVAGTDYVATATVPDSAVILGK